MNINWNSLHDCDKIYGESKVSIFRNKLDKKKELLINTILETINIEIKRYWYADRMLKFYDLWLMEINGDRLCEI